MTNHLIPMSLCLLASGCMSTRYVAQVQHTRVTADVRGSTVRVLGGPDAAQAAPMDIQTTYVVERRQCVAPWSFVAIGAGIAAAGWPAAPLVVKATQGSGGDINLYGLLTVAVASIVGGTILVGGVVRSAWCMRIDDREPGIVRGVATRADVVVEHGGYRPQRLSVSYPMAELAVTLAPAWRVSGLRSTDVYVISTPPLGGARALAQGAAEQLASTPGWSPAVVVAGAPHLSPATQRLAIKVEAEETSCRVQLALQGTGTRETHADCDERSIAAAVRAELQALTRS